MDDLISRKDAIDALGEEPIVREEWKDEYNKGMRTLWAVAKRDIESLPSIDAVPQWIPCNEMLPEAEKRQYWVCTDTGYQCQCRWTNDVYGLCESDRWAWKIFDIPQYQKVIAWMPLPKPYEEERKE